MEFFKYRFGKIPRVSFDKFESYLDPDINAIFITTLRFKWIFFCKCCELLSRTKFCQGIFQVNTEENPFKSSLNKSHELMQLVHAPEKAEIQNITVAEAEKFLNRIDEDLVDVRDKIAKLKDFVRNL